ncbi:MAG: DNA/RNA nuclease SfsA [Clostridia bacterium]|nr:DNA/RNA nuclease SfsA [Clostridia bacterium]MBO7245274.1 DNA/RNA nuclease SfsA [Clostridia bacterium]
MKYKNITFGTFLERSNRFVGTVEIDGTPQTVHIKNTGRCKELLVPGARTVLAVSDNPNRKTKYDLIAVYKHGTLLINMDSQLPNDLVWEWLPQSGIFSENAVYSREVTYGNSRFDLCVKDEESTAFIEVKGVTLEENGYCRFPDAPTERGLKHINELTKCVDEGYKAYIIFVAQFYGAKSVSPNYDTHPEFGDALKNGISKGVKVIAVDCKVAPDEVFINKEITFNT